MIRQVKQAVTVPVIGNGDIFSVQDGKRMLEETGCDGIMVGRGARGNPWIFRELIHYLETGEVLERPTPKEIKQMIERHSKLQLKYKGEYTAIREMRKHISWYTGGLPHSAALRAAVNQAEDFDTLQQLLDEWM